MSEDNLQRMIQLAEDFFQTKNDPAQISISEESIDKLRKIHPNTLTEKKDRNGPIAWAVIIPTTDDVMEKFLKGEITEQQLLDHTPPHATYDAIYLCSALVLPEHRGKGLARRLIAKAIKSVQREHPIKSLFYWSFSVEGKKLAEAIAGQLALPLFERMAG